MEDHEKNRLEHVQRIEAINAHLTAEVSKWRPIAEHWQPQVQGHFETDGASFTMAFGGKRITVAISQDSLLNNSEGDLITHITELCVKELVTDLLKPIVQPEVAKQVASAKVGQGAGKW